MKWASVKPSGNCPNIRFLSSSPSPSRISLSFHLASLLSKLWDVLFEWCINVAWGSCFGQWIDFFNIKEGCYMKGLQDVIWHASVSLQWQVEQSLVDHSFCERFKLLGRKWVQLCISRYLTPHFHMRTCLSCGEINVPTNWRRAFTNT